MKEEACRYSVRVFYWAQPFHSKSHGKQASPPSNGSTSTRRGFRVGVVDSFLGFFVWELIRSKSYHSQPIASKLAI